MMRFEIMSRPRAVNSAHQVTSLRMTTFVPSLRQTFSAGERRSAIGKPRHMMTMKTM